MILAIDFDGTIVFDRYPAIGNMIDGAQEAINKLYEDGHYIIIWTCRNDKPLVDCAVWLAKNGFRFHQINESNPENVAKYGSDTRKVYADVYIDDKTLGGLPPWSEMYHHINQIHKEKEAQKEFHKTHLG